MKVESLLVSIPHKEPRRDVTFSAAAHSVLKIPSKSYGPAYEVVAILDPTTRAAQKYTPVIMVSSHYWKCNGVSEGDRLNTS